MNPPAEPAPGRREPSGPDFRDASEAEYAFLCHDRTSTASWHAHEAPTTPPARPVALLRNDALLGVGVIGPEALPNSIYHGAWKIDALTVAHETRADALGAALLAHLLKRARQGAAPLVWCDARPEALSLYRSFGFTSMTSVDIRNGCIRMTCRGDNVANTHVSNATSDDDIVRIGTVPRLSRAVIFNRMAHIGGLLPNRCDVSVADQTAEVLEKIDAVLHMAGTDRGRLLSATFWIKELRHIGEANAVWEAWLPNGCAPARATVQATPGSQEYAIEIAAIAAMKA